MADLKPEEVSVWKRRINTAKEIKKRWYDVNRVETAYLYWRGQQRTHPLDEFEDRRAQVNKIHPLVANNIPNLYYYRPYARLTGEPEQVSNPGTSIEDDLQLLQDAANHLIRDKRTSFRESTFLALKESHWSFGAVEVGYSSDFLEDPDAAGKPALKEKPDTKAGDYDHKVEGTVESPPEPTTVGSETVAPEDKVVGSGPTPPMGPSLFGGMGASGEESPAEDALEQPGDEMKELQAELERLKSLQRSEEFFVKFVPSRQVLISASDRAILKDNDWIGYWEDVPLEDVKRCQAYDPAATRNLAANASPDRQQDAERNTQENYSEKIGAIPAVTLYKIWDLRRKLKYVFAEGGDKELMCKPFKRLGGLKLLRLDVDPYHFYPRPPLLSQIDLQDEYNDSREYLRKVRKGTVPRYTYNKNTIEAAQMKKLESGDMGTYIPVDGDGMYVNPIQQPSYSENAMSTLTLSDKEMSDVGGFGGDSRIAQSKTATQASIGESKLQAQDSFDRMAVADWLASIVEELLWLMVDNMTVDQFVAINVVPDGTGAQTIAPMAASAFQRISAEIMQRASAGVRWTVVIDVDSLSPVSEDQKFQKWMQGLQLLGNPVMARLFAVSPPILMETLKLLGIKGAKEQSMIADGMQKMVQMEQQLAAQSQNAAPGMPSAPKPQPAGPGAGSPQPPGPQGGTPRPPAGPPGPPR